MVPPFLVIQKVVAATPTFAEKTKENFEQREIPTDFFRFSSVGSITLRNKILLKEVLCQVRPRLAEAVLLTYVRMKAIFSSSVQMTII